MRSHFTNYYSVQQVLALISDSEQIEGLRACCTADLRGLKSTLKRKQIVLHVNAHATSSVPPIQVVWNLMFDLLSFHSCTHGTKEFTLPPYKGQHFGRVGTIPSRLPGLVFGSYILILQWVAIYIVYDVQAQDPNTKDSLLAFTIIVTIHLWCMVGVAREEDGLAGCTFNSYVFKSFCESVSLLR